jgi:hypothetical protein
MVYDRHPRGPEAFHIGAGFYGDDGFDGGDFHLQLIGYSTEILFGEVLVSFVDIFCGKDTINDHCLLVTVAVCHWHILRLKRI